MQVGQSVTLDFTLKNKIKLIAKQNDINSRYINITLCNNRQEKTISNTATATLNITRCDGQKNSYLCNVIDNIAVVYLSDWAVALEGIISCDVSIIENNERLTTMPFIIEVVKACCTTEDIIDIDSEDIITNLYTMLQKYEQYTKLTHNIITINPDDWELDNVDNKYKYTRHDDTVSSDMYIIANELSDVLHQAEIESNNGSYTIIASEIPSEAVNLLLIFLRGNE